MNSPTEATSEAPLAAVIILAAGEGNRMKSARSKLLHEVAGQSMLSYASWTRPPRSSRSTSWSWSGTGATRSRRTWPRSRRTCGRRSQEEQLGTGHAVQCALARAGRAAPATWSSRYGDVPHADRRDPGRRWSPTTGPAEAAVTVLTAQVPDPTGYGRIVRDADGVGRRRSSSTGRRRRAAGDHRDQLRHLRLRRRACCATALAELDTDNAQGELLPDRRARARPRTTAEPVARLRRPTTCGRPRASTTGSSCRRMNAELNRRILRALDAGRGDRASTRRPPGCTPRSTSPPTSPCCPAPRWRARPRSAPARRSARTPR